MEKNMEKKIYVTSATLPPIEEYMDEIKGIWESKWLTNMGCKHEELEKKLADFLDISPEDIALLTNGHLALECVFECLGLGKERNDKGEGKDEVITTPFTFSSTVHALVRKGLKPVFCDINEDNFNIDPTKIEKLITERTCAIVPVHVYGNICDIEAIDKVAKKYGLKVIYDGAHAFGVRKNGVSSSKFGDATMFSFHATKVFNTIEGGAICFQDKALKNVINQWKNFGITGPESVESVGGNAKMNEFAAAMGLCNLRHLEENIQNRKKVDEQYRSKLSRVRGLRMNIIKEGVHWNYAYFPIIIDERITKVSRDQLHDFLEDKGIITRKYFYPLVSSYDCYKQEFDSKETPIAEKIGKSVLTLPIYPDLSLESVNYICDCILELLNIDTVDEQ